MEIVGTVVELFATKKINEKISKKEILIEYLPKKDSTFKKKALLEIFSNKEDYSTNLELNKDYKFKVDIKARQLNSGKWINNLEIITIKSNF
jgi:hypothetical protein